MAKTSDKEAGKIPPKTLNTGTKKQAPAYSNGNGKAGDNTGGANAGKAPNKR